MALDVFSGQSPVSGAFTGSFLGTMSGSATASAMGAFTGAFSGALLASGSMVGTVVLGGADPGGGQQVRATGSLLVKGPSTISSGSILMVQDDTTGGTISFGSDGAGQTRAKFGVSGEIAGQNGEFQIIGSGSIPLVLYTSASLAGFRRIQILTSGEIGVGNFTPTGTLDILNSDVGTLRGYTIIRTSPSTADRSGLLMGNVFLTDGAVGLLKLTTTFSAPGNGIRTRLGHVITNNTEVFRAGTVNGAIEIGPLNNIGINAAPGTISLLQVGSGNTSSIALTGTTQRGVTIDFQSNSGSTSNTEALVVRAGTISALYSASVVTGIRIFSPVVGSGSALGTITGLVIDDQPTGSTSFAVKTGVGTASFGDWLEVINAASAGEVSGTTKVRVVGGTNARIQLFPGGGTSYPWEIDSNLSGVVNSLRFYTPGTLWMSLAPGLLQLNMPMATTTSASFGGGLVFGSTLGFQSASTTRWSIGLSGAGGLQINPTTLAPNTQLFFLDSGFNVRGSLEMASGTLILGTDPAVGAPANLRISGSGVFSSVLYVQGVSGSAVIPPAAPTFAGTVPICVDVTNNRILAFYGAGTAPRWHSGTLA